MTKASLSLSVNAIVVFVLAFALLAVGLGFTYLFQEKGEEGLGQLLTFEDLKQPASSTKPLTIDRDVNIQARKTKDLEIGFYNRDNQQHSVRLYVRECVNEDGTTITAGLPTIAAPSADVDANQGTGFRVIMKENGMPSGQTYICKLTAEDGSVLESKQFYLNVQS